MKYSMEAHVKKNAFKSAKILGITATYPFPYYPPGTPFELHGVDYIVESTLVCYAIDNTGDTPQQVLTHRLLLQQQP